MQDAKDRPMPEPPGLQEESEDGAELRRLGYSQQLLRDMGGFSNFALSFSIISILTGAVLLYGYGLKFGGPVVNTLGWPLVSLFTLAVAASMAELASAYPTAGGLYFWAFRLGGRNVAWLTAWLNMIGQVTITAGINIAAAIYLIGAAVRILNLPADLTIPVFGSLTNWNFQLVVMVLLSIPQVLINVFGIRLTARLTDFSAYWHMVGGAALVLLIILLGTHANGWEFMFSGRGSVSPLDAASAELSPGVQGPAIVIGDWKLASPLFGLWPGLAEFYRHPPIPFLFVLGLLQAQWTFTGYDASAHVAEETVMARRHAAWGVLMSVAVSAVAGWLLLLALTWRIPGGDVAATAADPYPILFILYANLPVAAGHLCAVIIGVAMWLCGLASITSMSRMWWAFARDDGMPGARSLSRIHTRYRTPVAAIVVTTLLAVLLCFYAAAYAVVTSISTITLYLAYGIPIYLNWRNGLTGKGESTLAKRPYWNIGRWTRVVNLLAIAWIGFICVVFVLPPNELVLWTLVGLGVMLGIYWLAHARRHFTGPTPADELELRRLT